MNTLATVLDDAAGQALIEKYLIRTFMERRAYDTVLANASVCQTFRIPDKSGQYCEATRKNPFRMPENVDNTNPTSDPASGVTVSVAKKKFPMEYLHEFVPISTILSWTSWIDVKAWAEEDMPVALQRRFHQLTQNAAKVGRFQPGKWAADGTAATAFDTTIEKTPTFDGVTFSFEPLPAAFAGGKTQFVDMIPTDIHRMRDYENAKVRMANSGTPKNDGLYDAFISEAVQMDLMRDDAYFAANIRAFKGEGLKEGLLTTYKGIRWHLDDEPFTEAIGAGGVRATNGQFHTSIMVGKGALAYTKLGGKSKLRPTFKVQDISKTGKETTIGYTIPFQVGVANPAFGRTITGAVTEWQANG